MTSPHVLVLRKHPFITTEYRIVRAHRGVLLSKVPAKVELFARGRQTTRYARHFCDRWRVAAHRRVDFNSGWRLGTLISECCPYQDEALRYNLDTKWNRILALAG